jgi:hypothetical protein
MGQNGRSSVYGTLVVPYRSLAFLFSRSASAPHDMAGMPHLYLISDTLSLSREREIYVDYVEEYTPCKPRPYLNLRFSLRCSPANAEELVVSRESVMNQ